MLSSDKSESLDDEPQNSCFVHFRCFFFLSRCFLFDLLYFLSSDESYSPGDDSDDDGSDYGSSGTYSFCAFYLRFDNSVGSVSGLVSGIFVPTGVESKCDIFTSDLFVPIGVDFKVG